jgi:hypothetical protein
LAKRKESWQKYDTSWETSKYPLSFFKFHNETFFIFKFLLRNNENAKQAGSTELDVLRAHTGVQKSITLALLH